MEKVYIFGHRNPDTDSVTAVWTPAIDVSNLAQITASLDIYSQYADHKSIKEKHL